MTVTVRISELPEETTLVGTESLPIVKSGATKRASVDAIRAPVQASLTAHVANAANPHATTAAQVGAAVAGGVTGSGLTATSNRLLGRATAGTGAVEEIVLGTGLSFTGTTLNAAAGGSGTPGGSTTQVQYNDAGAFAGDAAFTFDAAAKAITTNGYRLGAGGINAQTGTTYTLAASDNGRVVTLNNAAAVTVTVPASLGAGFSCTLIQLGVGQVTVTPGATVTINAPGGVNKTAVRYSAITLLAVAANSFILSGDAA
jgi:hypothetical protein